MTFGSKSVQSQLVQELFYLSDLKVPGVGG